MARKKLEPMVMTPEELEFHLNKFEVEMRHRRMWREQEREERERQITTKQALIEKLEHPSQTDFDDLARSLIRNFCIKKYHEDREGTRSVYYRFAEIEFYLYNTTDRQLDYTTLNRDCKAGQWFLHRYGVDIAFETKTDQYQSNQENLVELIEFGGILIRSLVKCTEDEDYIITGPQNCMSELFNSASQFPELCETAAMPAHLKCPSFDTISKGPRVLGKTTREMPCGKLQERYYVAGLSWDKPRMQIREIKKGTDEYHVVWKFLPNDYKENP